MGLKDKATALNSGFITEIVEVPEWGEKVLLREPSGEAWLAWQTLVAEGKIPEGTEVTPDLVAQQAQRHLQADVLLFIHTVMNEDGTRAFERADIPAIIPTYGPVHARLLTRALKLAMPEEEAAAKSETEKPSS